MSFVNKNLRSDQTVERKHITTLMRYIDDYERIKKKEHPKYKTVQEFYDDKKICKQNFIKYYNRYIQSDRNEELLLPQKRGTKVRYQIAEVYHEEIVQKIIETRKVGNNRYDIHNILKKNFESEEYKIPCPSTIYEILKENGLNVLHATIKEEKKRIIRMHAGSLGHIDIHHLPKTIIKDNTTKYYLLGIIDDYSRVCWIKVVDSIKALDVMFAAMDLLLTLKKRYGIQFEEMMTDNGPEFRASNQKDSSENHPFQKMLKYFEMKPRKTRPYRPQTNGKIERFWRTIEDDFLRGAEYPNFEELENAILGYCIYYNEYRPHQGINGVKPAEKLQVS